jgi:MFS family permease
MSACAADDASAGHVGIGFQLRDRGAEHCLGPAASALALMTAATSLWMFGLAQTFVGIGIACTGSSLAMTATARAASPERRSVVLGIIGAFSSVGTLVIAPVLQALLGVWDWRWGAVLFVVLAAAMVPAAMTPAGSTACPSRPCSACRPPIPRHRCGHRTNPVRRSGARPLPAAG